jgi:hypothetical protein
VNGSDGAQWIEAIKDEVQSLIKHGTWRPATLAPGRKAIGTRFVFKKKLAADGTVARYKGRLVAPCEHIAIGLEGERKRARTAIDVNVYAWMRTKGETNGFAQRP